MYLSSEGIFLLNAGLLKKISLVKVNEYELLDKFSLALSSDGKYLFVHGAVHEGEGQDIILTLPSARPSLHPGCTLRPSALILGMIPLAGIRKIRYTELNDLQNKHDHLSGG